MKKKCKLFHCFHITETKEEYRPKVNHGVFLPENDSKRRVSVEYQICCRCGKEKEEVWDYLDYGGL